MLKLKLALPVFLVFGMLSVQEAWGDGWRFWKKKKAPEAQDNRTAGPAEKQTIERAEMDLATVEKEIRKAQKDRARADKKRREEMAKALKKKEREMLKQQRDVERKQAKLQREQQRRLKDLSKSYQGKRSWKFWKKPDSGSEFFLPR